MVRERAVLKFETLNDEYPNCAFDRYRFTEVKSFAASWSAPGREGNATGLTSSNDQKEFGLAKDDLIPAAGTIIDKQPNAFFKVRLDNTEHVVLAAISGKMRKHRIRILVGDRVSVEMSPYDLTRGRITYRFK